MLIDLACALNERYKFAPCFEKLEEFGEGGFGIVHRVFDPKNRRFYAMKDAKQDKNFDEICLREIYNLLHIIKQNNSKLLEIYEIAYFSPDFCSIVTEYGMVL